MLIAEGLGDISAYVPLHLLGGFLIFAVIRLLLGGGSFAPRNMLARALSWSDSYSYEVYLVHQVAILGDFSLAGLFPQSPAAVILLALAWTLLATFVLHFLSGSVIRNIEHLCCVEVVESGK